MKKLITGIKNASIAKKALLGLGSIVLLASIAGGGNTSKNLTATNAAHGSEQVQTQTVKVQNAPTIKTEVKAETEVQAIPFTTSTLNDSALSKGQTKVAVTGINGSQTLTYEVTYVNGEQTDKKLISTQVDQKPVTQVTYIGTYQAPTCSNGSYINSAGNTVCRPQASSSIPAGATAKCGDGTYSFSQSRRGTCSHHGGVATWL